MLKRREALLAALFGGGAIGLRALATGLPLSYLMNPTKATAQDLTCALDAAENSQFLIVAASSMGDPINCNCPGSYVEGAIHPEQAEMAETTISLGGQSFQAALPWASTEQGGGLAQATLDRMQFFHYMTSSTVHGDQPKIMKLLGGTSGGEMVPSIYARHLAPCLGTVQSEPVALGAGGNATELLSYAGRTLPSVSPRQLKSLLSGNSNPLVQLRTMRDAQLDQLYALAKEGSNPAQMAFLDEFALTQTQVRALSEQLSDTLSSISGNSVLDQGLAAAALFSAKVTPVVTIRIGFGGDNHTDTDLQSEVDQHVTGAQGIQQVMDAVASLGLTDKVTFAFMNVFGRNLNGNSKIEGRGGRDHYGNHAVSVIVGKNVRPGVIGGVAPVVGSSFGVEEGALGAASIDSSSGAGLADDAGDILSRDTNAAYAITLGTMLGIPEEALAGDFVATANAKVVRSALIDG